MSSPKPDYDTPPAAPYNTPPALIAFTLAILVLCFVSFSIIYLCRYCFMSVIHAWAFQRTASGTFVRRLSPNTSPQRGLDPSLLQIFPTFLYGSVKDLRKEKYSLECAICLLEFEDDSMLRLLTVCCHVFHQECIDLWLCSHKTCPVCRTDLDSPAKDTRKSHELGVDNHHAEGSRESLTEDEIRIDVKDGEGDDGVGERAGDQRHEHDHDRDYPVSMSMSLQQQEEQRFARSHSTGHSIVLIRDEEKNDEKYTLRLPEHVIRGGHNCIRSCASYNEMTRPAAPCSNCGFVQTVSGCSSLSHTEKT